MLSTCAHKCVVHVCTCSFVHMDVPQLASTVSFAVILSQIFLNYLSNYLTREWHEGKCVSCVEQMVPVPQELPTVFVAVFIEQPTPFLTQFLDRLAALSFPKEKMTLFLRNSVSMHSNMKWSCVSSVLHYCRWSTTMRWLGCGSNRTIRSIRRCTT